MVVTVVAHREAQLRGGTRQATKLASSGPTEGLTPQELTVMRLLPSRLTVTEIAPVAAILPTTRIRPGRCTD